jgi:UrcA family protein
MMVHSNGIASVLALAVAATVNSRPDSAQQVVIEAEPLAQRIVLVRLQDLENRSARAKIEGRLRSTAKAVCDQQYPNERGSDYLRGCYAGSFYDARAQLSKTYEHRSDGQQAAAEISVAIRAR